MSNAGFVGLMVIALNCWDIMYHKKDYFYIFKCTFLMYKIAAEMSVHGNKISKAPSNQEKIYMKHKTKGHLQCINKHNDCIVPNFDGSRTK